MVSIEYFIVLLFINIVAFLAFQNGFRDGAGHTSDGMPYSKGKIKQYTSDDFVKDYVESCELHGKTSHGMYMKAKSLLERE